MKKIDPIILGIVSLIVVVVIGVIVAASLSSPKEAPQYQFSDLDRPKLEISEKNFEMGKIKLSDIKVKEITIKNIGTKPLNLSNFSTSCGCTTVELIMEGESSPKFSLHNQPNWQKELEVDQAAILKITYQPSLMPVEGEVERTVLFKTNDPDNLNVEINFKAIVEK